MLSTYRNRNNEGHRSWNKHKQQYQTRKLRSWHQKRNSEDVRRSKDIQQHTDKIQRNEVNAKLLRVRILLERNHLR